MRATFWYLVANNYMYVFNYSTVPMVTFFSFLSYRKSSQEELSELPNNGSAYWTTWSTCCQGDLWKHADMTLNRFLNSTSLQKVLQNSGFDHYKKVLSCSHLLHQFQLDQHLPRHWPLPLF